MEKETTEQNTKWKWKGKYNVFYFISFPIIMITQLIMPIEKKLIDKILPKDYVHEDIDGIGLYLDVSTSEIIASDGFVMLTLKMPIQPERPALRQFIQIDWQPDAVKTSELPIIKISAMYARLLDIWSINICYDKQKVPTWMDLINNNGKITIFDFQLGAPSPYLKETPKQPHLFDGEYSNATMTATKSKILFDNLVIAMWAASYQMDEKITSATGVTKNWYQFHLMTRTPLFT